MRVETNDFVVSDYLFARGTKQPSIVAAYPVSALDADEDLGMFAALNLACVSQIVSNPRGRVGIWAVLVDSEGPVLATSSDQASMIGRPLKNASLPSAIT